MHGSARHTLKYRMVRRSLERPRAFRAALLLALTAAVCPLVGASQILDPPIDAFPELELGSKPLFVIGDDDEDERYLLGEWGGAFFLPDGRIVLGDKSDQSIRIYSSTGEFEAQVGRKGEGPGEFQQIYGLGRAPGGGFWVYDSHLRRVTAFKSDGTIAETRIVDVFEVHRRYPTLGGFVRPLGFLESGEFLFSTSGNFRERPNARHLSVVRDSVAIWSWGAEDSEPQQVSTYAGLEVLVFDLECVRGGTGFVNGTTTIPIVHGGILWIASTDWLGATPVLGTGLLSAGIHFDFNPIRAAAADLERWGEARLFDRQNPGCGSYEAPFYEDLPAFGSILGTADGRLWFNMPIGSDAKEAFWFGFSDQGDADARINQVVGTSHPLGREMLPAPQDILHDRILIFRRGEFQEPRIEVWPLVRVSDGARSPLNPPDRIDSWFSSSPSSLILSYPG